MKPLNLITRSMSFGAGVVATLLLLEAAIRALPVISGTYAADPREHWPVHTMIPNSEYTYSTGWNLQNVHRGRINNYGYASPHDYQRGRGDIAVFGDSYIEALMNDYRDKLPGALNDYLRTPREVLDFGMSGAEMPDYLGTAALVSAEFSPDWAVFVITAGDFTNGFNAAPGYFEWDARQSPPIRLVPELDRSEFNKFSRTVGLVRYLRGNLLLRPKEMIKLRRGADHAAGSAACRDEVLSNNDEQLLQAFARELPRALRLPPARVIMVFDADRKRIYAGAGANAKPLCRARATLANERLAELARQSGIHVVDAEPLFRRHFEAGLGPLDRSPLDAHWNPAAHRLIAREVARVIEPGS
jgi:lysophospholipase L1-like esterase